MLACMYSQPAHCYHYLPTLQSSHHPQDFRIARRWVLPITYAILLYKNHPMDSPHRVMRLTLAGGYVCTCQADNCNLNNS